jgi:hypothetical protein
LGGQLSKLFGRENNTCQLFPFLEKQNKKTKRDPDLEIFLVLVVSGSNDRITHYELGVLKWKGVHIMIMVADFCF